MNKNYQLCTRCVMDTSDPDITFDGKGVCNHCHGYVAKIKNLPSFTDPSRSKLLQVVETIKQNGKNDEYDCVMGLSGGADSSYVAYLAKQYGLRPLAIHLDNGWNSELAVSNIEKIVKKLDFDLYTHVIDWDEFKDLQRSFLKASVVDIEMLSDHAITAVIYNVARQNKIKYILSGGNVITESMMPRTWTHRKSDLRNIMGIQKRFGTMKIRTFPRLNTAKRLYSDYLRQIKFIRVLNYVHYNREAVIKELEQNLGWHNYGGKHYESIFTQFYQSYILPRKFNIDKRRPHLSCLILSGQITREEALDRLKKPAYPPADFPVDLDYILKKLNFTKEEFDSIMKLPLKSHLDYPSDEWFVRHLKKVRDRHPSITEVPSRVS